MPTPANGGGLSGKPRLRLRISQRGNYSFPDVVLFQFKSLRGSCGYLGRYSHALVYLFPAVGGNVTHAKALHINQKSDAKCGSGNAMQLNL